MGPFIKSEEKTSSIMKRLIISLIPIIIFAIYKNGYLVYKENNNIFSILYPLIFILIGSLSSLLIETLYYRIFYKLKNKELYNKIKNSYSIFPGLFLTLVLPINTPIIILIIGVLFSTIVGKLVYGGFGNNIFNPALIGYLFILMCFGSTLSSSYIDTVTTATPLTNLKMIEDVTYQNVVEPYGNLTNLLIGNISGTLGEVSKLLIIISFIYLTITKTIKYKIPVFYITTIFILTYITSFINGYGIWYPIFHILSGGLLFGAVFMATDPVTSPITSKGQIIYGISLGILTFIFRFFTNYSEGVMLSILTMNMLVPIIEKLGLKKYVPILIVSIIALILPFMTIKPKTIDTNYNIISKNNRGNTFVYIVTQKGNGGDIKGEITFKNNKIINIEILENNETKSYYQMVMDKDYINKLIKNQDKLKELDTITGATITSNALKNMVINTIEDFEKNGKVEVEEKVEDTKIIDTKQQDNHTIYKVKTKTFAGDMILEIKVENKQITNVLVLEYKDTCYSKEKTNEYYKCPYYIEETNYIYDLINNDTDTITGVTITSKGIKNAIELVKESIKTSKLEELIGD